jgi:hypothetical protein
MAHPPLQLASHAMMAKPLPWPVQELALMKPPQPMTPLATTAMMAQPLPVTARLAMAALLLSVKT